MTRMNVVPRQVTLTECMWVWELALTTSDTEWAASAIMAVLPERYPVTAFPVAKQMSAARPNRKIFSPSLWRRSCSSWWEWPKCHLFGILKAGFSVRQDCNGWQLSDSKKGGGEFEEERRVMHVRYMGFRFLNLNPMLFFFKFQDKTRVSLTSDAFLPSIRW